VKNAISRNQVIHGFEVDDAARGYIQEKGFGEYFIHRTGHSIGEEVHGTSANMDNLETHDDRRIIAGTCFSIEPGVYLPEFGIRSEVNVYVGPGQARAMNFTDGVWAVEYARGLIPYSVPFGIADELLSCWDWVTAAQTLTLYTDLVCQSLGRRYTPLKQPFSLVSAAARALTERLRPPPELPEIPTDNIKFFR